MPATALPENYCVCVGEDGAPREIGRSGTAVTYKAMGYQSGQPVALQLIPLANVTDIGRAQFESKVRALRKLKHPNIARVFDARVEDDHIVFATEYLRGQSAEEWVMEHGPMPADAAVRIALQVVSALAEAAFHSLSHRSIQPSNLFILNDTTLDGDWPFVKLINFGLAGLKLYSEGPDELAPPIAPAFASPEQSEKGKVDFRSEIFSLGATLCFLLTGAVPLPGRARRSGPGERVLPARAAIPRPLRLLLGRMLRINPDERPKDPLLLTDELLRCLVKVKTRRPRAVVAPIEPVKPETPLSALETAVKQSNSLPEKAERPQFLAPVLTVATMLLLGAALLVVLLPGQVHWWTHRNRPLESIGVPIGIPDDAPASTLPTENAKLGVTAGQTSSVPAPVASAASTTAPLPAAPVIAQSSPLPPPHETPVPALIEKSPVEQPSLVVTDTSTPAAIESARESPAPVAENRNHSSESVGVSVGVPDNTPSTAPAIENSTVAAAAGRSDSAITPIPSSAPSAAAVPASPVIAQSSPPSSQPKVTGAPAIPEQSPSFVATVAGTPPAVEPVRESPAPVVNNRMAEPPPPQEAPAAAEVSPPPDNAGETRGLVAEQAPTTDANEINPPAPASPPDSSPSAAGAGDVDVTASQPSRQQPAAVEKAARDSTGTRALRIAKSTRPNSAGRTAPAPARDLPQMRVGGSQASLVGTTANGQWILRLASGNTVVTPPLPKVNEAAVISRRRVRRVAPPPLRARPADDRPPVVVLPPD